MNTYRIQILSVISIYFFVAIAYAGTYSGVYNGTFSGTGGNGEFAILVDANDIAVLGAFDTQSSEIGGGGAENIIVNSDGSFNVSKSNGTRIDGIIIAATSVSGTYIDSGGDSGSFSGLVRPYTGLFADNGGYYKGLATTIPSQCGGENSNTDVYAIVAADGFLFFVTVFHENLPDEEEDGGIASINSDGSFSGTTVGDVSFSGALSGTPPTISGSGVDSGCHFNFSLNRVIPLSPPPPLDSDGDGIFDNADNCPIVSNANQNDQDSDGIGDVCDSDRDGDNISNSSDNCPTISNSNQNNQDGDSFGDVCDSDRDGDGISNISDNCPTMSNSNQNDRDGDGIGDVCDDINNTVIPIIFNILLE